MLTAIVIPCLNEARLVGRTARSLGFGFDGGADSETRLILVDNGSTDDTWTSFVAIRDQSAPGAVLIAREAERGYVPPRDRGARIAAEMAEVAGIAASDLLILQGDADTVYESGYVDAMRGAALVVGGNHMLEAVTRPPPRFLNDHPGFQRLADRVDAEMAAFAVGEADDVIVDDKVAGYRLGDYLRWGGHCRDYMPNGAEVHAETTRLFIRARRLGARKACVNEAKAIPSRRKIQRNPVRHFSTAGFPREEAWWRAWNAQYSGPNNLKAFDDLEHEQLLDSAVAMRRAHLLALFTTIPQAVALSLASVDSESHAATSTSVAAIRALQMDQLGRFFQLLLPAAVEDTDVGHDQKSLAPPGMSGTTQTIC